MKGDSDYIYLSIAINISLQVGKTNCNSSLSSSSSSASPCCSQFGKVIDGLVKSISGDYHRAMKFMKGLQNVCGFNRWLQIERANKSAASNCKSLPFMFRKMNITSNNNMSANQSNLITVWPSFSVFLQRCAIIVSNYASGKQIIVLLIKRP